VRGGLAGINNGIVGRTCAAPHAATTLLAPCFIPLHRSMPQALFFTGVVDEINHKITKLSRDPRFELVELWYK